MSNPIYILHLTDFHLSEDPSKGIKLDNDKIKLFLERLQEFLNSRARTSIDILCITGDMMDLNGNINKPHTLATNFINEIKNSSVINNDTKIYCTPGNHDINFKNSQEIVGINEMRVECIDSLKEKEGTKPFSAIVDKFSDQLANCFEYYTQFIKEINSNNFNSISDINLNYLNGFDLINLENNKKIFVSWFNTSWLSQSDKNWNIDCNINAQKKIINFDHGKLSPGFNIIKPIIEAFNNSVINSNTYSISLSHHDPKLLSPYDKKSIDINSESFYWHLNKYSLVLNGHTHNNLFAKPFLTSYGNFIPIIEANIAHHYNIHHKISWESNIPESGIILDSRISVFNDSLFIENLRSKYNLNNLLEDLKYCSIDTVLDMKNMKYLKPGENNNLLEKLDYDLEQKSKSTS